MCTRSKKGIKERERKEEIDSPPIESEERMEARNLSRECKLYEYICL